MKPLSLTLLALTLTAALLPREGRAAFLPVCSRTPAVTAFLELTLKKKCADITAADLITVKRVDVGHKKIKEFKADDFTGLFNLEILNIRSNEYTELPEGLLKDLVNLKTIVIIGTTLRHYPDDFLAYAPNIENLHAFRNNVRTMSESLMQRLEAARGLKFIDFDASLQTAEKNRLNRLFPAGGAVELALIGE